MLIAQDCQDWEEEMTKDHEKEILEKSITDLNSILDTFDCQPFKMDNIF